MFFIPLLPEQKIQQWEHAPDPEGVATVHELVSASLEAPLERHLTLHGPLEQPVQVERMRLAYNHHSCQAAKRVAAMRLVTRLPSNAAFVCLALPEPLRRTWQH